MDQFNVNDLLSSLSPDDMDSLKSLANSLLGSAPKKESKVSNDAPSPNKPNLPPPPPQSPPLSNNDLLGNIDAETIAKIGSIMSMLNNNSNDERVALINALKPLLSEQRRDKADEALKIIRMMEILPILKKQGIF